MLPPSNQIIQTNPGINRYKFPRIYHLPWSPGTTSDDRLLTIEQLKVFEGKEIVVTEKLDGENFGGYSDGYCHARSINSGAHPSRDWVKALLKNIAWKLPAGYRICGENMFAKHSIFYDALPSYFFLFAIFDQNNLCLSWDDTLFFAQQLEVEIVPQLYRGPWDVEKIKLCLNKQSKFGEQMEGYVLRIVDAFHYDNYSISTAKYVRKGHVQTSEHWLNSTIVPNKLKENV